MRGVAREMRLEMCWGKSEVGFECDSKYARVIVEWEVSGINSNSRVVVGLWFILCKESD